MVGTPVTKGTKGAKGAKGTKKCKKTLQKIHHESRFGADQYFKIGNMLQFVIYWPVCVVGKLFDLGWGELLQAGATTQAARTGPHRSAQGQHRVSAASAQGSHRVSTGSAQGQHRIRTGQHRVGTGSAQGRHRVGTGSAQHSIHTYL